MNKKPLLLAIPILALLLLTSSIQAQDEVPPDLPTESPLPEEPKLINRLNYQTNEYDLGKGQYSQTSSLEFVNYKDGDEFKEIDMTLIDYGSYWKTTKSVYYPTIPKYADEWSRFNNVYEDNNHSIKIKPVAAHIEGIVTANNVILYPNAFGDSIDLEVTAYNGHLLRKIIIRKPQTETLYFDFEIDIDEFLEYKSIDSEKTKRTITLNTGLKAQSIEFTENKTPTTIYPMKVWDSSPIINEITGLPEERNLPEFIDFKFYEENGKLYFRKEISKKFLEKAVYPVFTDDDTGAGSPGTMADDAAVGTRAWSNPDNAKVSNDTYAQADMPPLSTSHYLKATNFSFNIPTATIDGVVVEIERFSQIAVIQDMRIKLVVEGSVVGDDNSGAATWQTTDDNTYVSFGSSSDGWSAALTVTKVNASDFGMVLQQQNTHPALGSFAWVDHIRITVYYTAEATCTSYTLPGTAADDDTVGTLTWSNPDNIKTDNANAATASPVGMGESWTHYLKATNFGFDLPSNATISGIKAKIKRKATLQGPGGIIDSEVKIVKGGVVGGTNRKVEGYWSSIEETIDYGAVDDLWGETWTYENINSSTFGLVLSADILWLGGGPNIANIYFIKISVCYIAEAVTCDCPDTGHWNIGDGSKCTLTTSCTLVDSDLHISNGSLTIASGGHLFIPTGHHAIIDNDQNLVIQGGNLSIVGNS